MSPLLLFAHGAGAGVGHPWMQRWITRLSSLGEVVPFEYPYMKAGRKRPDRLPKLLEAHRAALDAARPDPARPTILVGKSMGSRVGCHLAHEASVHGLVCFGYPLVSVRGAVRDEVLLTLPAPVLFIQGTRDRLCPLDALADVRSRMAAPSSVHVVEGGNHSLEVGKRALAATGRTQDDVDARITEAIAAFLAEVLPPPSRP